MRIAIIGAGIAGVTSAYELAADGHEVIVFERRGSVAAESSFANAGFVVPGLALPWSAPRRRWPWLRNTDEKNAEHRERLLKLAVYSREHLQQLRRGLQLDYERAEGALVLLRTAREQAAIAPALALLDGLGLTHRALDAEQCRAVEPGLNPETLLLGGVQLPLGEVGNCRQFAHQLRLEAQRLGVQFRFHTTVRKVAPGHPLRLQHEYTPPAENAGQASRLTEASDTQPAALGPVDEPFDAVIICAAGASSEFVKLPLAAVKGCSITAPLRQLEAHPDLGPRAGLLDQQQQVAISRIGQRVRVAGGADVETLHKVLHDWFPGAMQSGQVQRWQGTHAQLADGLPMIGASGQPGIWLNLAHSTLGWPLACGAARVLAEQIAGLTPEIDVSGLGIERLA